MTRATTLMMMTALLAGCSTRPRDFAPNMAIAPVNQDVQMRDFAVCKMMVDRGVRGNFAKQTGALTPGAVGVTAGAAIGYATAINAALSTTASALVNGTVSAVTGGAATTATTTTTAGAATLSTALPIIGVAASVAIAAGVKKGNEKKVKSALGACMKEYGHDVTAWQVDRTKMSALPVDLPRDPVKPPE